MSKTEQVELTPEQVQAKAAEKAAEKERKESEKAAAKAKRDEERAAAKVARDEAKAAEKAAKLEAREAAKAQKEADKEAAKAAKEAERMPEQNGVRRPKPATLCGQAWAIFDSVSAQHGTPAAIGDSLVIAKEQGLNEGNVKAEYARWRKFNGVVGRVAPVATAETAPTTE